MSTLIKELHRLLNGAVYAHGPLRDAVRAVLEVHRPQRIYDDCGHRPHDCAEDGSVPAGLVELEGIGLVCESGYPVHDLRVVLHGRGWFPVGVVRVGARAPRSGVAVLSVPDGPGGRDGAGGAVVKRSSLQRKTGLRRVAMPPRTVPLKRSSWRRSPSVLGLRKPGRPRVTPEERQARELVYARSGGVCEACDLKRARDWHHRVRRSQGGAWSASNGLHLCRWCHEWIGEFDDGANKKGWALEPGQVPAAEPVCYRGRWVLLADDGSMTPAEPPALEVAS